LDGIADDGTEARTFGKVFQRAHRAVEAQQAFGQRTSFKAFADMISCHFNEWRINSKTTILSTGKACLFASL
ncbi:hypothetical protein, partial [Segatella oris]|uniref:hypothetical protein n=1 Tax=Segatella oris TaxID=28135 RepID=UPI00361BD314